MTRALLLALLLSGCGGPLSLLTGGGPNVAANVQAAKTATQTLGSSTVQDQRITSATAARDVVQSSDRGTVKAESVQTIVVHQYPAWLIIAFAIALFLDSPLRWAEQIRGLFRR